MTSTEAGKLLEKNLLNRPHVHLYQAGLIPGNPCGFRKDRGTISHDLYSKTASREMSKAKCGPPHGLCRPQNAFGTVSRDGLWKSMAGLGCPPRLIAMMRQFHDDMQTRANNDGEYFEPFPVTNGIKQCCVMAPTLFSLMCSVMLIDAFHDCDAGFPIRYRFDGKLLNLMRLQAKSKVQSDVLDKLL